MFRRVAGFCDVAGESGYRIYRADDYPGPYQLFATTGPDQTAFEDDRPVQLRQRLALTLPLKLG